MDNGRDHPVGGDMILRGITNVKPTHPYFERPGRSFPPSGTTVAAPSPVVARRNPRASSSLPRTCLEMLELPASDRGAADGAASALADSARRRRLHAHHAPQWLDLRHVLDHHVQEEAARLQPVGQWLPNSSGVNEPLINSGRQARWIRWKYGTMAATPGPRASLFGLEAADLLDLQKGVQQEHRSRVQVDEARFVKTRDLAVHRLCEAAVQLRDSRRPWHPPACGRSAREPTGSTARRSIPQDPG